MDYSAASAEELFRICADTRDSAAWQEFLKRFNPILFNAISRVLRRSGAQMIDTPEDVLNAFYQRKLLEDRVLTRFVPNTSPEAFLYSVARYFALDQVKSARAHKHGAAAPSVSLDGETLPIAERSEGSAADVQQRILVAELEAHVRAVVPEKTRTRDLMVFDLYYRQGFTASQIADIPAIGLGTKGVESLIGRLMAHVRGRLGGDPPQGQTPIGSL